VFSSDAPPRPRVDVTPEFLRRHRPADTAGGLPGCQGLFDGACPTSLETANEQMATWPVLILGLPVVWVVHFAENDIGGKGHPRCKERFSENNTNGFCCRPTSPRLNDGVSASELHSEDRLKCRMECRGVFVHSHGWKPPVECFGVHWRAAARGRSSRGTTPCWAAAFRDATQFVCAR